jgi:hypothetical protein
MFECKKIRHGLLLISVLLGALRGHAAVGESGLSGILAEEQILLASGGFAIRKGI